MKRFSKRCIKVALLVILIPFTAYIGGYVALRYSETISFRYPSKFLNSHLDTDNPKTIVTRNNAFSYDPLAEIRGFGAVPLSYNVNETNPMRIIVSLYGPAMKFESLFRSNLQDDMRGKIPAHVAESALRRKMRSDASYELSHPSYTEGQYHYHHADGREVELSTRYNIASERKALVEGLLKNPEFKGEELQPGTSRYKRLSVFRPSFYYPRPGFYYFQKGEGEHIEYWLVDTHERGDAIHYHKSYTDQ